jgi:hypothetical protein
VSVLKEEWKLLLEHRQPHMGWQVRRVYQSSYPDIFAAIAEPEGHLSLILEVPPNAIPPDLEYPSATGFQVFPELARSGSSGLVRLCLSLSDARFTDVFVVLAEDVADAVSKSTTHAQAVKILLARLRIWQRFMQQYSQTGLSPQEQTGLWGELFLFSRYLLPNLPTYDALKAWSGPSGAVNDFYHGSRAAEVKSTVANTSLTVQIPNLLQLDETSHAKLFLAYIRLANAAPPATTLPALIKEVREIVMIEDSTAVQELNDKLTMAGYMDQQSHLYDQQHYSLSSIRFFEVRDTFPRLRPSDVPLGVQKCSYVVDLRFCDQFEVPEQTFISTFLGFL